MTHSNLVYFLILTTNNRFHFTYVTSQMSRRIVLTIKKWSDSKIKINIVSLKKFAGIKTIIITPFHWQDFSNLQSDVSSMQTGSIESKFVEKMINRSISYWLNSRLRQIDWQEYFLVYLHKIESNQNQFYSIGHNKNNHRQSSME